MTSKSPLAPHEEPLPRILVSGQGETKTGKSSFPMWGPDPVLIYDLDRRLERVVQRFREGDSKLGLDRPRTIETIPLRLPRPDEKFFTKSKDLRDKDERERAEAERMWNLYVSTYKDALEGRLKAPDGRRFRTISIDTLTELQDLRLVAEFGRLIGFRQRERGGANSDIVELIRMAESYDVNVVWLHQMKDEYLRSKKRQLNQASGQIEETEESEKTGRRIIKGYDKTPYITQAHLLFDWDEKKRRFVIEVERCGVNADLNRRHYSEEDWAVRDDDGGYAYNPGPFAFIAAQMTGTDPSEWIGAE